MKKIAGIGMGLILLIGTMATGNYGLSRENKEIYQKALEQQDVVDELGFENFRLSDYPVAFFDGNSDYVMSVENGTYRVDKRKPVLNTFAGTAYLVDDHYEIILPTVEKFEKLFDVFDSARKLEDLSGGEHISFEKESYGETEQIATIWHEAFHAYQFTHWESQIEELLAGHTFSEEDLNEDQIVEEVDSNEEVKAIYEKELALLKKAVTLTDVDRLRELILQYKKLEEERRALLPYEVLVLEEYYQRVEGTAHYVEGYLYKSRSEDAFDARYIDNMDVYAKGSYKYYAIGMAQCMIADTLDDGWKTEYDFSQSIMDLIYERLGIENGL